MAISRYSKPAGLEIIDSYVPLPFKEIKAAINEKQNEWDLTENTLDQANKPLSNLKIHQNWYDSSGNFLAKNKDFELVREKQDQIENIKNDIYTKYKGDWSNPEAQREVKNLAYNVAMWSEKEGKRLEEKSKNYEDRLKENQKQKLDYGKQDTYSSFDDSIYNEVAKQQRGESSYELAPNTYYSSQDKNKIVNEATTNLGETLGKKTFGINFDINTATASELKQLYSSNKTQIEQAKAGTISSLNDKHNREVLQLARELAPRYGKTPEELFNTKLSNGITWGQNEKERLNKEVESLFNAKLKIKDEKELDWKSMSKGQLASFGKTEEPEDFKSYDVLHNPVENIEQEKFDFNKIKY